MTITVLDNARLAVGGVDLSGFAATIGMELGRNSETSTMINQSTDTEEPTLKTLTGNANGLLDLALVDTEFFDIFDNTGKTLWAFAQSAAATGDVMFLTRFTVSSYETNPVAGELMKWSATFASNDSILRGVLMDDTTTHTTSESLAEFALGAVGTTEKLVAQVHVVAASGTTPTLDLIVESDAPGFAAPVTRLTFSQVGTTSSARLEIDGPITDTDFRFKATIAGTTPSFTLITALAIVEQ